MSREHSVRTVEWATDLGRETGVPTVDEWRRASEVAEFELTSFDRREAGSFLQIAEPVIWAALIGPRRRVLVAALENAQLGLARATEAAEAEAPDEPTTNRASLVGTGTAPREALGLTERQIREATATVRKEVDGHPTRVRVAERLNTTEVTVKRAMKALGMGRWPPAPPED